MRKQIAHDFVVGSNGSAFQLPITKRHRTIFESRIIFRKNLKKLRNIFCGVIVQCVSVRSMYDGSKERFDVAKDEGGNRF